MLPRLAPPSDPPPYAAYFRAPVPGESTPIKTQHAPIMDPYPSTKSLN